MGIPPHHDHAAGRLSPERSAVVEAELNAILTSSSFSGSKRCQDFLEFIVRQALEGNYEYLTERFLGAELFGRPINYETGTDSIVRVRANDVRRRLAQYYADGHEGGALTIDLVSGSYVPDFHWSGSKTADLTSGEIAPHESPTKSTVSPEESVATSPEVALEAYTKPRYRWIVACVIAIGLVFGFSTGWWLKDRSLDQSLHPLKYAPSMNALWSQFLGSNHETDVVLSDASFQLLQDIGKRKFTLNDYLNRNYLGWLQSQSSSPDMQSVLTLIASKNFGNSSEFRLAQRVAALDRLENRVHIYNSRDYSSTLATQDNVVLIGSRYSNPWQELFESQLNFAENPPGVSPGTIVNKAPKAGERPVYTPSDAVGYCIVAYLQNPDRNTKALLIEGSSSEATEAGGDFLLSEDMLASLEKTFHSNRMPYFEVLLKTSQVRGTPITATIEAYRIYSNQP